jgi:Ran GTPase-activating protein 1
LSAICDSLKDKTSLIELDLSDNAFGSRSVDPIVPFLTHNRSFQVFKLNNNGLGPEGGTVIADALAESARLSKKEGKPSQLRTLICGRNRLQDGSSQAWAKAFIAHGSLVEVRMPQNGIRMDGIANLAHGLAKCPNLEYLDLQDNTFGEDGSAAMAKALPVWTKLTFLNFSDCVLSSEGEGVSAVIETIAKGTNPKLQTLQLQNNNMETVSFALLVDGISKLPCLKTLELQWNEVDDEDEHLETLAQSLKLRGGKVFLNDDEEEEEEEDTVTGGAEAEGKDEDAAKTSAAVDDLADLLTKTTIV